ncbi:MAG: dUTP diphosphatase [Candidatus Omnitrophica bacterium]|nr:dUTP diphosphatase [Candidatus Omnitrophota bacterium]
MDISVKCLPHHAGLSLPAYMSEGSAGMDLMAAVTRPIILNPGERALIPTGISLSIPVPFEAQVRPRSGLAYKYGITVLNAPGTIDSDYRGEVQVILINLGKESFTIQRGDRIAQLVFTNYQKACFKIQEELDVSKRNEGGFGHTGV